MFKTVLTASILAATLTTVANAGTLCNPAIQNWVNGSHMTCPMASPSTKRVIDHNNPQQQSYTPPLDTQIETGPSSFTLQNQGLI